MPRRVPGEGPAQAHESRQGGEVGRREPPEQVVVGRDPGRHDVRHDRERGALGDARAPRRRGKEDQEDEGDLRLHDLPESPALDSEEPRAEVRHQRPREEKAHAEQADRHDARLAVAEEAPDVLAVRVEQVRQPGRGGIHPVEAGAERGAPGAATSRRRRSGRRSTRQTVRESAASAARQRSGQTAPRRSSGGDSRQRPHRREEERPRPPRLRRPAASRGPSGGVPPWCP